MIGVYRLAVGIIATATAVTAFAQAPASSSLSSAGAASSGPNRPAHLRINMQDNLSVRDFFSVGPTRFSLHMTRGEERTVELQLTNRQGELVRYMMETQDFGADENGSPKFFGNRGNGPFPARTWLEPEVSDFELLHGERAFIRIRVSVPMNAEPGDHQAAVVIRAEDEEPAIGGLNIVSSVASLFLITVDGEIIEDGHILGLHPERFLNWTLPVTLFLSFRNEGTVHLIPEGVVEIRNIFGVVVDEIPVQDWAVLRDSSRTRKLFWEPQFAFGRYKAVTDLVLTSSVGETLTGQVAGVFWVIPLLPVLLFLLLVFLVSFLVQYFFSRFEIRKKGNGDEESTKTRGKRHGR